MTARKRVRVVASLSLALGTVAAGAVEIGAVAPSCVLAPMSGTPQAALRPNRGKVVYVDFWASWCLPCARSFPFMEVLQRDFAEKGLQVIAINVDEDPADAAGFLRRHPARFGVGADSTGRCPLAYGVMGMPSSYIVDRRGVVRYVHVGFRSSAAEQIRKQVELLLAESADDAIASTAAEANRPRYSSSAQ